MGIHQDLPTFGNQHPLEVELLGCIPCLSPQVHYTLSVPQEQQEARHSRCPTSDCLTAARCDLYNQQGAGRNPVCGKRGATVPVQMELKRIIISEIHEQQVILLREVDGDRSFSIMIGIFEATSIDRRVKKLPSPRPLTHDLVANVVENLGGELRDIFISELRDHTYFAKLRIRMNGELVEVDCRPSDAIALAVTANVPIYVAEDVLNEVCGE